MHRTAAALVVVALGASACGQDEAETGPLVAAAERTARERSASYEMKLDVDVRAEGTYTAEGTGTMTTDASRMTMLVSYRIEGEKPIRMEIRNVGDEFWMRSRAFPLPPGKRWVHSVDPTAAPSTMGMSEFLEMLRSSGDVDAAGAERVQGRATTHYEAKVPVRDIYERSPPETRRRFERFKDSELEMPIEVWVDAEGLLRRLKVTMAQGDESFALDTEIVEYGVRVGADEPPPAQVVEEEEVLPGG